MADDATRSRLFKIKDEHLTRLERNAEICRRHGDEQGVLEGRLARAGLAALLDEVDIILREGAHPTLVIAALARGFGIPITLTVVALTMPGTSVATVDLVVPAIGDIARDLARTQDTLVADLDQGRLFS